MRTTASLQSTRAPSRAARRCTTWTTTTGALAHVFGRKIFFLDFYKFFIFFLLSIAFRRSTRLEAGKPFLVCGNTASMLSETWLSPHFAVHGSRDVHYGAFPCGPAPGGGGGGGGAGGACCV